MECLKDDCVDLKSLQIETDDKPSLSSIQSGGEFIYRPPTDKLALQTFTSTLE